MALRLQHQTTAQFAARYWRRVREASGAERARLIYLLIEWINAGDVTDAQARLTFNAAFDRSMTAVQWAAFKSNRLVPMHDRHAAILAEGEL